jgi:hypothetical protein
LRKILGLLLVLALLTPAVAIDKTGLFSFGGRAGFWIPFGEYNDALTSEGVLGAGLGFGLSEAWSIYLCGEYIFNTQTNDYFNSAYVERSKPGFDFWNASMGVRWNLTPRARFDPFFQVGASYYAPAVYVGIDTDEDGLFEELSDQLDPDAGAVFGASFAIGGEFFTEASMSLELEIGYGVLFDYPVPRRKTTDDLRYYYYDNQMLHLMNIVFGVNLYL